MNQRKPNKTLWYSLGLAVLLLIAILVGSAGTTLARYRAQRQETIQFWVRPPEPAYLGKAETAEDGKVSFVPTNETVWETSSGQTQLEFAVANGASKSEFASRDLQVRLRLIGSLGLWNGTETTKVILSIPSEDAPEQLVEVEAVATPINEESPLYNTFGNGWTFSFQDAQEEELTWTLDGGKLSFVAMKITIEDVALTNTSLLQLQVLAEAVED